MLLRSLLRTCLQASLLVFVLGIVSWLSASPAHAALTLTAGSNATTTPNVATAITGFQIVGAAASTTPVQLRVSNGSLSLLTTTGLTFNGASSGATINFSGTVANINAALSTLQYTRTTTGSDTLEVSLVEAGEVFFLDNNHLYKFIAGSYTWDQAKTAAEGQTLYGASGYLATITSAEENTFVYERISGDGWLGATDAAIEDTWIWATGPEAGTTFYSGRGGAGGSAVDGQYNSWATNEPNDFGTGEDCGYMYASQDGDWNDFPCSAQQGYVVEFGAPGDLPTVVAANITIVTADVPAVTSLSPTNGATEINPTSNLTISFSKTVVPGSGSLLIKKSADNSTVESIDVTGDQVTGSGSSTITINPSIQLDDTTQYYVLIPETAFLDASDNPFEGISSSGTWSFTTSDITPPTISSVTSTAVSSSAVDVIWTTNEAASSKVIYGVTSAYGRTTSEADTGTRVTSHTVQLTGLVACTVYQFTVVSRDASLNSSTSTNNSFTTTGCTANTMPTTATSTSINSAAGGRAQTTTNGRTLQVDAPSNVTATSSSLVIQISEIPNAEVLASIGRPASLPNEVGSVVFDVKAIINHDTVLDSFDHEVTITYTYIDDDLGNLDERTVWLYHYHDGVWSPLNDCSVVTQENTITCTTPSFSLFGLFGDTVSVSASTPSSGGGMINFYVKPTLLPNLPPFILNRQQAETYTRTVPLSFNADPRTVKGYAASLSPDFPLASIFPLATTTLTLPDQPRNYTVYLKYFSTTGEASETYTQDIRLVTGTPTTETHTASTTSTSSSRLVSVFVGNWKRGQKGEEVRRLQQVLNRLGFVVSTSGAGSVGQETTVYGSLTLQAVMRFQEHYAASILAPLGLRQGTGIFGSATRSFLNELLRTET